VLNVTPRSKDMAESRYICMHLRQLAFHADNGWRRVVTFTLRPFASWKTAHNGLWMGESDGNRLLLDTVESKKLGILSSLVTAHRPSTIIVCTTHIFLILKYFIQSKPVLYLLRL
jgi:hypothetical protein